MEDARKRNGCDGAADDSGEKRRRAAECGENEDHQGVGDDILPWLSVDDDTVSEVMKLLDEEKTEPIKAKVRFIDDPYSSPLIFQSSSSYVTINGNEESCGSSFSESDSSVMASVDIGGANVGRKSVGGGMCLEGENEWMGRAFGEEDEGEWGLIDSEASGLLESEEPCVADGKTGDGWDDNALARFIGEDLF